jgi:hypothetical protein
MEGGMTLANFNLDALREKVLAAYQADHPRFRQFRDFARRLSDSVRPLRTYSANAVSFVSADGGDNRLTFNPVLVELVRVVDSRGNQCALDAVASTATLTELEERARAGTGKTVSPLERMCSDLRLTLRDLSYLIRSLDDPNKSTGALRVYRDIVEWAVLYDLATNPILQWGGDTILVRDGLLRTKAFRASVFPMIDQKLREGVRRHAERNVKISIVGVAKQSAVLSRLAVALELEATFHRPYPCYVPVPADIEAACYNFDRTWLLTYDTAEADEDGNRRYQSLGRLFLVKFGDGPLDPVWPVDIGEWDVSNTDQILGQLSFDAQQGFPIPDYPMCIQQAHEYAQLKGLEIAILQDLLVDGMTRGLSPDESERLLRMKYLGQNLAALRYKEG